MQISSGKDAALWISGKVQPPDEAPHACQNPDHTQCQQGLTHCWWDAMVQPLWKMVWWFLTKVNILFPQDPATVLPGIHSKDWKTSPHQSPRRDVHSSFVRN